MPQQPSPFITRIYKFFPMAEGVFLTAFAVGLVLQWMDIQTSIIFISLLGLSTIYFLGAYAPPLEIPGDEQPQGFNALLTRTIVPKVLGIGCSVVVVGVLFYLTSLKGFRQMLFIGTLTIIVSASIAIAAVLKSEVARKALMPLLLRAVPLGIIGAYILLTEGLNEPQ